MITRFVSRHPGAADWAKRRALPIDEFVAHLDMSSVVAGDIIVGTLPVHLVAAIVARGARYVHLALDLPAEARGQELTVDDLDRSGARLTEVRCEVVGPWP